MSEQISSLENTTPVITEPTKSRVTVVETVYYQPVDGSATTMLGDTSRYARALLSEEEPYTRHKVLKGDWATLDCGWIDKAGMLLIQNNEGTFSTNPSSEHKAEVFRRVIELSFGDNKASILIPPNETCRFYPADMKQISLRCQEGAARYTICLIPE